jgi:hypothetical protein
MRRLLIVPFLVLGVGAPAASAAVVERDGNVIRYSAVDGDKVDVALRGANSSANLQVSFVSAPGSTPASSLAPCFGSGTTRTCSLEFQDVVATGLHFRTAGGDDRIRAAGTDRPVDSSLPIEFELGAGADDVVGGRLADVVRGGSGNDRLDGGPGADRVLGETGDDVFVALEGADRIDGGPGRDLLDLSALSGGAAVSLDGLANDGPLGVAADVDVEDVRGTAFTDLLVGGEGSNDLAGGAGDDVIDVRGGGADLADCGPGDDRAVVDAEDSVVGCETVERPPVAPVAVDGDGDGVLPPADCDDGSAVRRPGARDVPGNGVDEDCSGADARLTVVPARVAFNFAAFRNGAEARRLRVRDVPRGGRVVVVCESRGCGFRRRAARVSRAGGANLMRLLAGRRLPAGLVFEVRVTAPEHIGKVTRFRVRAGKLPRTRSLCLRPGDSTAVRCDSA